VGLALALALGRALAGMLFGVSPFDPVTLAGVAVLVPMVAALAAFLPALRAARIDPMEALREE
jgi:ABC-type antimicrobial peptide transport system permease subunit